MIWTYGNERFFRFAAYQAAVLEDIARDLEENARPGLRARLILAGPPLDVAMAATQANRARREEEVDAHP